MVERSSKRLHIVIIGGGVTGLAGAHHVGELARKAGRDVRITVLEAANRAGGVIQTVRRGEFMIEAGPDNFVTNKPAALALCKQLGIDDQLLATNSKHRRALIVRNGKLLPIPEGFLLMAPTKVGPMLKTKILSWSGKLRMACEPWVRARQHDGGDESLASLVTRRFGREALDRLVQPLIGGIYNTDPRVLSVRATMPQFLEFEQNQGSLIRAMRKAAKASHAQRNSGARYSLFMTLRNGLDTLIDSLVERIGPANVQLNSPVKQVSRSQTQWVIHTAAGQTFEADAVLCATRGPQAADMFAGFDRDLTDALGKIQYSNSAVVHAAYRREQIDHPLDGFGFVVPTIEGRNLTACSFSSVKYSHRAPKAMVLLRGFWGGQTQPNLFTCDDADMTSAVLDEFSDLLGVKGSPQFTYVHRYAGAMPQYRVGHMAWVKSFRALVAKHRGLAFGGNTYDGVGIPDCIASGQQAAAQVWRDVHGESREPREALNMSCCASRAT